MFKCTKCNMKTSCFVNQNMCPFCCEEKKSALERIKQNMPPKKMHPDFVEMMNCKSKGIPYKSSRYTVIYENGKRYKLYSDMRKEEF